MYTPDSLLTSTALGRAGGWAALLDEHGAVRPDDIARLYFTNAPLVGLNADLALAQAVHETGWFSSPAWRERRNPAGIGMTGPGVTGPSFGTPEVGIRAHLAHLACYIYTEAACPIFHLNPPNTGLRWYDPRHHFHDGKPRLADLIRPERKWANPGTDYVAALVKIANDALAAMPAPAPTSPISRVDHLPLDAPNRPNQRITPRFITCHETANTNPGATAEMHRQYVHGGGGPQLTSYNYVVDDRETIELVPVGWASNHAGTAEGNLSGVSIELCVNQGGDWERTQARAVELIVHLLRTVPTLDVAQVVPHNHWRNTACPARLMAKGKEDWHALLAAVDDALAVGDPDAELEAHYQAVASWVGDKRYAALLDKDYYRGRVLICQRGVVTQTGQNIAGHVVDDWLTYNAGQITKLEG